MSPTLPPGFRFHPNDPGSTSAYCPLSPRGHSTSEVLLDEPDAEMERLLDCFFYCNVNNTMLPLLDNGHLEADLIGKGKATVVPGFDGNDTNTSSNVQAYHTQINEAGIDFSVMQNDGFVAPLDFSVAVGGTEQFPVFDRVGSYFNENMQGDNLSGAARHASCTGQLTWLPRESEIEGFLNVAQMENDNYYHGSNTAYPSDFLTQPPMSLPPEESKMADSFLNVVQMEIDNYYLDSNAMRGLDTSHGQQHNEDLFLSGHGNRWI